MTQKSVFMVTHALFYIYFMNADFWVTRDAICQRFSLVTSSLVKIFGKSPHSWPKNRHSWLLMHYSIYISCFLTIKMKTAQQGLIISVSRSTVLVPKWHRYNENIAVMKGQSEIAYLPKFANMMLIVMVIVITEILYIILIFDCFENQ